MKRKQPPAQLTLGYAEPMPPPEPEPEELLVPGFDDLLADMNPEQAEGIKHGQGPMAVLAGAGSGKTRVIIHRVGMLVRSGVSPQRILAVTFSTNGQHEMERRGLKMGLRKVDFRTWHSIALMIIQKGGTPWEKWVVDGKKKGEEDEFALPSEEMNASSPEAEQEEEVEDEDPQSKGEPVKVTAKHLLRLVVGRKNMDWDGVDLGQLRQYIGYCKACMWGPDSQEARELAKRRFEDKLDAGLAPKAYRLFDEAIEEAKLLTYDDMLLRCVKWLEQGNHAERWASHWDYLLQDEAQDASPVQIRIAHLLARGHRNYFVVGDPAQAIFGFRGSDPVFLLEFAKQWAGAKVITMFRNYRCGSNVVKLANAVIGPSSHRLPKDIVAEGGWEGTVTHHVTENPEAEASLVAASIQQHIEEGSKYGDNVVLYRLNSQSRAMEEKLLHLGIPYYVVGGVPFYDRREIKGLLAYLRIGSGVDVVDSLRMSIKSPNRYLGRAFIAKAMPYLQMECPTEKDASNAVCKACDSAHVNKRQVFAANEYAALIVTLGGRIRAGQSPFDLLRDIISKTGYENWIRKEEGDETVDNNEVANVKELLRVSSKFKNVSEMLIHIDEVQREAKRQAKSKKDRVLLMTLHKSKGLEFKHVHFLGAVEKIIPHPKAEDEDEERRLFYVGVTRAAQTLMITSPQVIVTRMGTKHVGPSTYLIQAALQECIDLDGSELAPSNEKIDKLDPEPEPPPPIGEQTTEQRVARLYEFIRKNGNGESTA